MPSNPKLPTYIHLNCVMHEKSLKRYELSESEAESGTEGCLKPRVGTVGCSHLTTHSNCRPASLFACTTSLCILCTGIISAALEISLDPPPTISRQGLHSLIMDDDYGADDALLAAMAATDPAQAARGTGQQATSHRLQQPTPQKIQQPTPQRLDKPPPASSKASSGSRIVQPTPQALPQKHPGGSTILVSPRQRGNPVLTSVRSMPWEYSDIPADFVLGATTCALFLRFDMPPSVPHNKKQLH